RRNPVRLRGLQHTTAAAAQLTRSALSFLEVTREFDAAELEHYAAELAEELPELFVHLPAEARGDMLARLDRLATEHPLPGVRQQLASLSPVLLAIEEDMRGKAAVVVATGL